MKTHEKKLSRRLPPRRVGRMVETVVGCKWSLTVIDLVQRGICRPGAMERAVDGLTAKVLNDCLRLLVSYTVLEKHSYPEVPPRVEYRFTPFWTRIRRDLQVSRSLGESVEAHPARGFIQICELPNLIFLNDLVIAAWWMSPLASKPSR